MLTVPLCPLNHLFPQQAALLTLYPQVQPDSPESAYRLHQAPASTCICRICQQSHSLGCSWDILVPSPTAGALHSQKQYCSTVVPCLTSASRNNPTPRSEEHFFQKHLPTVPGAFLLGRKIELSFIKEHPSGKEGFGPPLSQSTI